MADTTAPHHERDVRVGGQALTSNVDRASVPGDGSAGVEHRAGSQRRADVPFSCVMTGQSPPAPVAHAYDMLYTGRSYRKLDTGRSYRKVVVPATGQPS